MMTTKHTPGPWVVAANFPHGMTMVCHHTGQGWVALADCSVLNGSEDEKRANAMLIAEIPNAIGVIKQCRDALAEELSAWDIDPPIDHVKRAHDACNEWLATIAKATGDK